MKHSRGWNFSRILPFDQIILFANYNIQDDTEKFSGYFDGIRYVAMTLGKGIFVWWEQFLVDMKYL